MAINSRTKGANFEREIGNLLVEQLGLSQPVKRILEQTRTKELPDLKLGRWCLECKRYGDGVKNFNVLFNWNVFPSHMWRACDFSSWIIGRK